MNSEIADQRSKNWYLDKNNRPHDTMHSARLFYFDACDEYGWLREDEHRWYRLNCSYWFGDWIEENGTKDEQWEAYGGAHRAIYMVRDDFMSFIKLKWL